MTQDQKLDVPRTLDQAFDPVWLAAALAPATGGAPITAIETVEVVRGMATKVRFTAAFDGARNGAESFCLKAFLDVDSDTAGGGATTVLEADFYTKIAPHISVRVPECVAAVVDRKQQLAVLIMRDLIADGARFCTALEPFSPEDAALSLDQIARLHAKSSLLYKNLWIGHRIKRFAEASILPLPTLQDMLNGARGEKLSSPRTRDASLLMAGLKALTALDEAGPQFLLHGDCHAANFYQTPEGPGLSDWQLLQRGGWALDVAYHICAVLPADVAAREERALLNHYLDTARGLGAAVPQPDQAWDPYRRAVIYGYYLWAITRRVKPEIINECVYRLGSAVARHESYKLLGL